MFYEKITQQELNFMTRPDGITPNYTFEDYIVNYDAETGEKIEEYYVNLTVHMTADKVYEKWLADKENPTDTEQSTDDKMEVRLGQIEDAIGILATQVAQNTLLNGGVK